MSLKIAILAPIKRAITADTTISRNRVIVDLAQGLTEKGHTVTIFAAGGSSLPDISIIEAVPKPLVDLPAAENPFYQHTALLTQLISAFVARQGEFDLVHNHMYPEFLALLAHASVTIPMATTIHAQMTPEMVGAISAFPQATLVAISESAKRLSYLPLRVIHNGIDTDFFAPDPGKKREYLLFIGRMSKAKDAAGKYLDPKGVTHAIAVAKKLGMKLKIVGNIEEQGFYDELIAPHLSQDIELVGGVSSEQTLTRQQIVELYEGAIAFVNPIAWEEPFGLVMAEAASCGVPVVAYRRGSVPELVADGITGVVVDPVSGIDGLAAAVEKAAKIDPAACRAHAVANFSVAHMVSEYEKLYEALVT
jgi:glycosyltransferase involved in cell wall biosynthesis